MLNVVNTIRLNFEELRQIMQTSRRSNISNQQLSQSSSIYINDHQFMQKTTNIPLNASYQISNFDYP